jgi:hypothetical protein
MPGNVLAKGEFEVKYDQERELYYVELPITPTDLTPILPPGGMQSYEITLDDVWTIPNDELVKRSQKAEEYFKKLKDKEGTQVYEYGEMLRENIAQELKRIVDRQKLKEIIEVRDYISNYRENKEKLALVDKLLEELRLLAYPELAQGESPLSISLLAGLSKGIGALKGASGILGAGEGEGDKTLGITRESAWKLILIIMTFLGLLSVVFFLIWQSHLKKARVSPEFNISPESVQMPEMGKSEDIGRT